MEAIEGSIVFYNEMLGRQGIRMKLLNKLERKFGRYAIHNLMYYIIVLQVAGIAINILAPSFIETYLSLDVGKVLQGQVWRLFTFVLDTGYDVYGLNILFTAITLYLYYMIGRTLENIWGAFRFNLYYLSGILFNIVAAFILYFLYKNVFHMTLTWYGFGLEYLNYSLFLAFACIFPNQELFYMFLIPIKMKYLGILYGIFILKDIYTAFAYGIPTLGVAIIVALLNFIIFFLMSRNYRRVSPREINRKKKYQGQVRKVQNQTRHRCAVCGRTEEDDETLEFRYCSKCDGNYEYCMEHLFTHEHVKKH